MTLIREIFLFKNSYLKLKSKKHIWNFKAIEVSSFLFLFFIICYVYMIDEEVIINYKL